MTSCLWNEKSSDFGVKVIVRGISQESIWWPFGVTAERSIEVGRIVLRRVEKQGMTRAN
jgi:hypothetical protein